MTEYEANFPQSPEGVRDLSWAELRKMLEPDRETRIDHDPHNLANLEMARRIVNNCERVVNYYMGVMNRPLIARLNYQYKIEHAGTLLYEFLSQPFSNDANLTPMWLKVSQFKGFNEHTGKICRLRSYTSTIASRKFYGDFKKLDKLDKLDIVYLEEILSNKLYVDPHIDDEPDTPLIRAVRRAFQSLSEVHKITLELLIIEEMPSLMTFDILKEYMNPRQETLNGMSKEEYFATLTNAQKQNRVSLLKGQALNRFRELVKRIINELK